MAALLALSAAVTYGVGDFLGGVAARRAPVTAVVLWSHVVGLALMLVTAPLIAGEVTAHTLALGGLSGIVGAAGVTLFYWAFSLGRMSVVAPVAALLSAAVPAVVGIARGDRPDPFAFTGIAIALLAVVLVSRGDSRLDTSAAGADADASKALLLAIVSGCAFGLFFVGLDLAPSGSGLWPLVGARVASVLLFVTLGATGVIAAAPPRAALLVACGSGALDSIANVLYLVALSHGMLSVVAVLSALYPASTLVLARWVLGERMTRTQQTGLACAVCAALLMAA